MSSWPVLIFLDSLLPVGRLFPLFSMAWGKVSSGLRNSQGVTGSMLSFGTIRYNKVVDVVRVLCEYSRRTIRTYY